MAKIVALVSEHPLNGTWRREEYASSVEYTFRKTAASFDVSAIDTQDGEVLEIEGVSWNGEMLTFVSFTPSTNWRVAITATPIDADTIEFASTIFEELKKKPD